MCINAAEELGAAEICNIYGQTETYGNCCVTWHHWPLERRADCQGAPLPGVHVRIRDPTPARPVRPATAGHVEVRGYLTRGYGGASAAHNAEAFTADGYFRTGDLGASRDGTFQFAGAHSRDDQAHGHQRLAGRDRGDSAAASGRGHRRRDRRRRRREGRDRRRLRCAQARRRTRRRGAHRPLPRGRVELQGARTGST